jgi:hypothetical protein
LGQEQKEISVNPLIAKLVAISPFSPINHIWFDLSDLHKIYGRLNEKLKQKTTLKDLVEGGLVENYPMPFEKIAVAMTASPAPPNSYYVVTMERVGDVITFSVWGMGFDGPASTVIVHTYLNHMKSEFNPKYQKMMADKGITDYRQRHLAIVGMLLFTFISISHGDVPPEHRTGYRCIDNPKNIKRIKRGKKPLFEWETIVVESKPAVPSVSLGGTHASPKPHDRRGHQRRLKSGKTVYIRPTTINKHKIKTEGFIHHDYRVAV